MLRFFLFLLVFTLSSCSTGGRNSGGSFSLLDSNAAKNDKLQEVLEAKVKTESIYLDYSTEMQVDALYQDLIYRLAYAKELSEVYYLADNAKAKIWRQHTQDYENFYTFVVVLYPGSNKRANFGRPSAEWQAYLKDDEGDLLRPVKIVRLDKKNRELIFLHKYLRPLDRWSQTYLVRFPKLHRNAIEGSHAVKLIISGISGKAVIKFTDLSIFVQDRQNYQLD
ncbi:MAG: hypothetical protein QNL04_11700 [SAR324 cluster bacterium]|nr:hypothetical protein [SAR324 cluster bacterium]